MIRPVPHAVWAIAWQATWLAVIVAAVLDLGRADDIAVVITGVVIAGNVLRYTGRPNA